MNNPYSLNNNDSYLFWRNNKLNHYPTNISSLFTRIKNSNHPSAKEVKSIQKIVNTYNLGLYRFVGSASRNTSHNKNTVHTLGKLLGLVHLDNNICADTDKLTSIEVRKNTGQHEYIPYSSKKLSWHTDGYYNTPDKQIRGMLLHCAQPATEGGDNLLMDTDIAYILLRDENPDYIKALMQAEAMTIPANILKGETIRAEQTGPVFSIDNDGALHMRYSARTRNIIWSDDKDTLGAVEFLQNLWESDSPYILRYKLKAGEGLVCNNVLHSRTEFVDSDRQEDKRLLYRGRYYDRLNKDH